MASEFVGPGAEYPVPMAGHVVERRRLHDRLSALADVPVTVISAPPGSGKTLLVASWVSDRPDHRCAWVTLRAADDSSHVFWRDVGSALAEVLPGAARAELRAVVREPVNIADEAPAWLARLILQNAYPITLILDNLHEVNSADIHRGILQLVSHAAPRLRTIVISRHDPPWPVHRMQLDGRVRELRAADLAFDQDEAAALFRQMDVPLTPHQLDTLLVRTEGWAGGLRLAGLGISTAHDPMRFIDDFSGDDHVVADYLMREVFERQPLEWQDFLLRIAIVEEVCGDLADALTGRDDGARRLAQLADANVFVHRLGGAGQWYRLHNLLLDFLHGRLSDPALRRDLHLRAATWFATRDRTMGALRHALSGEHWRLAADVLSVHVATLVLRNPPGELEAMLTRLPFEVLVSEPELAVGLAAARLVRGDTTDAQLLSNAARAQLARLTPDQRGRLEVMLGAVEIGRLRATSDLSRTLEACQRLPTDPAVLGNLGFASWNAIRLLALGNMGTSELWLGDLEAASKHLEVASGPVDGVIIPRLNARSQTALLHWIRGDLDQAATIARETIAEFSRSGMSQAGQVFSAYLAAAGVAIDRDELDVADRWLTLAAESAVEPHAQVALATMRARRHAVDGDLERGVAALRGVGETIAAAPVPQPLADHARLVEAELLRRLGRPAQAEQVSTAVADPASWPAVQYRVRAALDLGDHPVDDPTNWPVPRTDRQTIDQQLLRVHYAVSVGARAEAHAALESALVAAEPQRLRRSFLDEKSTTRPLLTSLLQDGTRVPEFVVDLLDRMSGDAAAASGNGRSAIVVPLTEREGLMLRYLASTLTNSDISRALYISLNTVKTHQRMIYRKLAVNDRRDAVARGRELGLL